MKQFFLMTFPNGHVYQFPTEVLVTHLKQKLRKVGHTEEAAARAAGEFFKSDDIVAGYVANAITWAELQPLAMLVDARQVPLESHQADVSCHDEVLMPAVKAGADLSTVPVKLLMSCLELQKKPLQVMSIESDAGETVGAVAIVRGDREEIEAYAAVLDGISKEIQEHTARNRPVYPH